MKPKKEWQLEVIHLPAATTPKPTPLLFVHGAWHAAWCWENFLPYFASQGYEVYALSLRGHGASEGHKGLRWFSAAKDYVDDVAQVARGLKTPPVVIGHSMGGYVVQKYLEKNTTPGGVLLASTPVSGIFAMCFRLAIKHPLAFLKTSLLCWPWYLVNTPKLAKESFFSESISEEDLKRHFSRLQPESFRMVHDCAFLHLPKPKEVKTPMLVLAGAKDQVFTLNEQKATAEAYGTEMKVFANSAHDIMLEPEWKAAADYILNWLRSRNL